jgi:hypothetical protein
MTFSAKSLLSLLVASLLAIAARAGTTDDGLKWLAAKRAEPGVVALPSGLLYKEIRAGAGKTPTVDSPCDCHYSGTLIDGTEFDSSYKRGAPLTFAPNQVRASRRGSAPRRRWARGFFCFQNSSPSRRGSHVILTFAR